MSDYLFEFSKIIMILIVVDIFIIGAVWATQCFQSNDQLEDQDDEY